MTQNISRRERTGGYVKKQFILENFIYGIEFRRVFSTFYLSVEGLKASRSTARVGRGVIRAYLCL